RESLRSGACAWRRTRPVARAWPRAGAWTSTGRRVPRTPLRGPRPCPCRCRAPGRVAIPVGQAVAAEAGQDHQVDVLYVGALRHQVFGQPTEDGRLDVEGVVGGRVHGRSLAACRGDVRQYAFPFTASTTA